MDSPVSSPLRRSAEDNIQPPVKEAAVTASPARGLEDPNQGTGTGSPARSQSPAVTGSPAQSPLRDGEDPIPTNYLRIAGGRREGAAAVVRSPLRDAEDSIPLNLHKIAGLRREAAAAARSPLRDNGFVSPLRSPLGDEENPRPNPSPDPMKGAHGTMTVASILRSPPLWEADNATPTMPREPSPETVAAVASRMAREPTAAEKRERGLRVDSGLVRRRSAIGRVGVGLRVLAVVLSLISFSVMAADKTTGWAGDSFDRYTEFRYCLTVNVLVFVYSSFQVYAQVHRRIKRLHIIRRPVSYYFDFAMDQILAYLLMSASSAAASRNDAWVSSFGSDEFTRMINSSVAMSFLAFFALALSALISTYRLFSWNP